MESSLLSGSSMKELSPLVSLFWGEFAWRSSFLETLSYPLSIGPGWDKCFKKILAGVWWQKSTWWSNQGRKIQHCLYLSLQKLCTALGPLRLSHEFSKCSKIGSHWCHGLKTSSATEDYSVRQKKVCAEAWIFNWYEMPVLKALEWTDKLLTELFCCCRNYEPRSSPQWQLSFHKLVHLSLESDWR